MQKPSDRIGEILEAMWQERLAQEPFSARVIGAARWKAHALPEALLRYIDEQHALAAETIAAMAAPGAPTGPFASDPPGGDKW